MAVNEKAFYANTHVFYGDPRRPLNPGDPVTDRVSPDTLRSMQERGQITTSHAEAQSLARAEQARREDVARQIGTRSEKRGER